MNRQSWSCEEDEAICSLVAQFGLNDWTKIAQKLREGYCLGLRTGKQCRERWYNHLNPAVNKKPWDSHEEERLFQLHKIHGNRWKDISRHFTGRTDNDIKNHFYSTLRRSLRRLNKISGQKNSTSQMREIKPSVLSTIMNYIYDQQHTLEGEFVRSLQDLPTLIFEFANFKPVKTNLRHSALDDARDRIAEIFALIARFNEEYERNKLEKHITKMKRQNSRRDSPQTSLLQENPEAADPPQERKFCSETTLKQEALEEEDDSPYIIHLCREPEAEPNERLQQDIQHLEKQSHLRNMSLDAEDLQEEELPELREPQMHSIMGEESILDLTVVGRHWEPQSWEREAELKIFVDEVLQSHYDV